MLFSNDWGESGCFLLTRNYDRNKSESVLLVIDVVKPDEFSWNVKSDYALEPTSSFINKSVVLADVEGAGLVFVHTHPGSGGVPMFSEIDRSSNSRIFGNLRELLPDRPLGSVVLSKTGALGVVFQNGKLASIDKFRITGKLIEDIQTKSIPKSSESIASRGTSGNLDANRYERQVAALGIDRQKRMKELTATIVGLGGTGSSLAVQLARMGVARIRLIDMDVLDESNLSRVYGSSVKEMGKPKVTLVKNHLRGFSDANIEALQLDVTKENSFLSLLDSDIIFGCTDNLASRAILNDVAIQYFIPYIDIGCRITLDSSNNLTHMIAKVQVVFPNGACLWCTGTLDGVAIMRESLPDEEKRKLRQEGYYQGVGKQPSIISLTTLGASLGVVKMLGLLGFLGCDYGTRTQIEFTDALYNEDSPASSPICVCKQRLGKAGNRRIA